MIMMEPCTYLCLFLCNLHLYVLFLKKKFLQMINTQQLDRTADFKQDWRFRRDTVQVKLWTDLTFAWSGMYYSLDSLSLSSNQDNNKVLKIDSVRA